MLDLILQIQKIDVKIGNLEVYLEKKILQLGEDKAEIKKLKSEIQLEENQLCDEKKQLEENLDRLKTKNDVNDEYYVKKRDLLRDPSAWTVVGYGACGVVCRAIIKDGEYERVLAVKACHETKSGQEAVDEIRNEANILHELNAKGVDFVPTMRFYGRGLCRYYLATDFIDGMVYDEFEEMPTEIKTACMDRVIQLHSLGLMHGDLRAPNFIVKPGNNVVVIDFGRSKFFAESKELLEEMEIFKDELYKS